MAEMGNYGRTTYGGGGMATSAFGERAPYQGNTATDALRALINSEQGGYRRRPARVFPRATPTLTSGPGGMSASDQRLADMERRARIMQLQAAAAPPPTKTIHGANIIPGQVIDPLRMNAYQRQLYLPQGSQFESPEAEAKGQAIRDENERRADDAFNAMVSRRRFVDRAGTPVSGIGG